MNDYLMFFKVNVKNSPEFNFKKEKTLSKKYFAF